MTGTDVSLVRGAMFCFMGICHWLDKAPHAGVEAVRVGATKNVSAVSSSSYATDMTSFHTCEYLNKKVAINDVSSGPTS